MLAVFSTVAAVQVCTAFSDLHTIKIGTDSNGVLGDLHVQNILPQKESCSREAMDQCEYACLMPGGVLDLYCYEDCIYSIC